MNTILIDPEFFGPDHSGPYIEAKVLVIFRDSNGDQWAAFELADMAGVYVIHLGSTFVHQVDR